MASWAAMPPITAATTCSSAAPSLGWGAPREGGWGAGWRRRPAFRAVGRSRAADPSQALPLFFFPRTAAGPRGPGRHASRALGARAVGCGPGRPWRPPAHLAGVVVRRRRAAGAHLRNYLLRQALRAIQFAKGVCVWGVEQQRARDGLRRRAMSACIAALWASSGPAEVLRDRCHPGRAHACDQAVRGCACGPRRSCAASPTAVRAAPLCGAPLPNPNSQRAAAGRRRRRAAAGRGHVPKPPKQK